MIMTSKWNSELFISVMSIINTTTKRIFFSISERRGKFASLLAIFFNQCTEYPVKLQQLIYRQFLSNNTFLTTPGTTMT